MAAIPAIRRRGFIEDVFGPLLEWNRWRFRERDKNGNGLMELASTPYEQTPDEKAADGYGSMTKQGAMWESGLNNSTMFDRAVFNEKLCCLEQSYAGLNGLMAADCDILAKMARLLGRDAEVAELTQRRDQFGGACKQRTVMRGGRNIPE